jgi:hypothetical protein
MSTQNLLRNSLLTVIVSVSIFVMSCKNKSAGEEGWHDLFDGKTLTGWKVLNQDWTHPDTKPDFYVEDNMIVCNTVMGNEGGYLITEKTYSDFILELDVKIDTSLNSGVQCRGRLWDKDTSSIYVAGDPNGTKHDSKWKAGEAWGYQIEVDPAPRAWSGGLYEPCNRGWLVTLKGNEPARKAFKPMEWNHFKIIMQGNRIQTWVNDVPIVDTTDELTKSGFIGFQFHGAYHEWQKGKKSLWKNIRIKEL